tara:strand:- start:317 stop:1036 length:720 start_codon:yes stop_codon:yes gene_type:complete
LEKLISIKEARIKKGLSINDLSKALKLDIEIIRLLDDNLRLPKKYKSYQSTYKKSIYRYLGYDVNYKSSVKKISYDHTKIFLVYFFLLLIFIILFLLSFNIYNKFNKQNLIKNIEKDQVYDDVLNITTTYNLTELSHEAFINNLIPLRRVNYSQKLSIFSKSNKTIYYKIQNNNKKTIQFGEILQTNELNLELDNDFLIDLSNINNIEKIIYRGIEIKVNDFLNFYLVNFKIKDLDTLL